MHVHLQCGFIILLLFLLDSNFFSGYCSIIIHLLTNYGQVYVYFFLHFVGLFFLLVLLNIVLFIVFKVDICCCLFIYFASILLCRGTTQDEVKINCYLSVKAVHSKLFLLLEK